MFRLEAFARAEPSSPSEGRVATGMVDLDALLGGGLPRGQILEISGGASCGKSTLAFGACLSLLKRGQSVAWVDPTRSLWPLAALEARLPLEKLLVLRVPDGMAALRATHLLLSCRGAVAAAVVTFPSGFVPAETNLVKLLRLAEQASAALVLVTERPPEAPSVGSCVALRLCVRRRLSGPAPGLEVEVARDKHGPARGRAKEPHRGPDRLRVRSTL